MASVQLVQKAGVIPLSRMITQQLAYGWAVYGNPFDFQGNPAQLMVLGDMPVGEVGEYRLIEKDGKSTMESQIKTLIEDGWTLYGDPFEAYGLASQAVIKGNVPRYAVGEVEVPPEVLGRITTLETVTAALQTTMAVQDGKLVTKASLVNGKVPYEQLPEFPVGRKVNVADQAARLALPVYADLTIAYQSDTGDAWGLDANDDPAVSANWSKLGNAQALGVASFNGRTGNIAPQAGDYTTATVTEAAGKRYVTEAQIALWNQAPNPGVVDQKIADQKAADDLVYETKTYAAATYLPKADLPAPLDTSGFMLKSARDAANGVAPLGTDRKVPAVNLPTVDLTGLIPTTQKGVANGVAALDANTKIAPALMYRNVANGFPQLDANARVLLANLPTFFPQKARIWRDVTSTREKGTWYTNTSTNEMELHLGSNNAVDGSYFNVEMKDSPTGALVSMIGNSSASGAGLPSTRAYIGIAVPIGWMYRVNPDNIATRTIAKWYELS